MITNNNLFTQASTSFQTATGKIPYTLLNDYMFHYLFQTDKESLKMLICALLDYDKDMITDLVIENPIIPGSSYDSKGVVLDLRITLAGSERINLELQVVNEGNWTDRSLLYLCRNFDRLEHGNDYTMLGPATHIGIIDYDLIDYGLTPEFYARYKLMNEKNHEIYNSKFSLNVLSLKHIELATTNDCNSKLDYWASIFKAKTWEDIKMLAEKNEVFENIAQNLYTYNSDYQVREDCRRREEQLAHERYVQKRIQEMEAHEKYNQKRIHEMEERDAIYQESIKELEARDAIYQESIKELEARDAIYQESIKELEARDAIYQESIKELESRLAALDRILKEKEQTIKNLETQLKN